MKTQIRELTTAAIIAAMYAAITWLQNLLPGGGAWGPIQFRVSEALCVLAFFTPAAIPGLGIGCFLFNLLTAGTLPLDPVVGTLASVLSACAMYLTRRIRLKGIPLLGMVFPALFNAILVGWELTVFMGGGFSFNAICVALGELGVLYTLGLTLFLVLEKRKLAQRLFGPESNRE